MALSQLCKTTIFCFLLSGCASIRAEVTTFSQLPANNTRNTFVIVPEKSQQNDLEFEAYSALVTSQMAKAGYQRVPITQAADYALLFDYSIGAPQTISAVVPVYGQTGGGYTYQSGAINSSGTYGQSSGSYSGYSYAQPTYGVTGEESVTSTTYTRNLVLVLFDNHTSTASSAHAVFQGTVISQGSSDTFARVAGCLIDALFTRFPGPDGTATVTIPASQCAND